MASSGWFNDAVGTVKGVFGGIQADIHLGGGQPSSAHVQVGEKRVMSATTIVVVAVIVYLLATRGKGAG